MSHWGIRRDIQQVHLLFAECPSHRQTRGKSICPCEPLAGKAVPGRPRRRQVYTSNSVPPPASTSPRILSRLPDLCQFPELSPIYISDNPNWPLTFEKVPQDAACSPLSYFHRLYVAINWVMSLLCARHTTQLFFVCSEELVKIYVHADTHTHTVFSEKYSLKAEKLLEMFRIDHVKRPLTGVSDLFQDASQDNKNNQKIKMSTLNLASEWMRKILKTLPGNERSC